MWSHPSLPSLASLATSRVTFHGNHRHYFKHSDASIISSVSRFLSGVISFFALLKTLLIFSWAMFARGENVRCDYNLRIKVNVAIGVARIIYLCVGRHNTEMREESSKDEMEDPMGNLLIKGMTS
jgi:hypothetical protein